MRALLNVVEWPLLAAVALATSWPFVHSQLENAAHPRGHMVQGDGGLYIYLLEVECRRLLGSGGGLWDGGFYFPLDQTSLLFTEPQWGASILAFPMWLACDNPLRAYVFATIVYLVAAWFGLRIFVGVIGGGRLGGWLAASMFGIATPLFSLILRPFFWGFFLVPIVAALVHVSIRRPSRVRSAAIGFVGALLIWSSCHLAVMGGLFVVIMGIWSWRTAGRPRIMAIDAGLALLPPLVSMLVVFIPMAQVFQANGFERPVLLQATRATPPLGFLMPPPWSRFSGWLVDHGLRITDTSEQAAANAPVASLLVLIGLGAAVFHLRRGFSWRRTAVMFLLAAAITSSVWAVAALEGVGAQIDWWPSIAACAITAVATVLVAGPGRRLVSTPAGICGVSVLVFALLAMGPLIPLSGGRMIATPGLLVSRLPGFGAIRMSSRYALFVSLSVASMAALLVASIRQRGWRYAASAMVVALLAADYQPSWPSGGVPLRFEPVSWNGREVDRFLKDRPGPGAVLELPISGARLEPLAMLSRLIHGRPVVNGSAGFIPALHARLEPRPNAQLLDEGQLDEQSVIALRSLGARYWVLNTGMIPVALRGRLGETIGEMRRIASFESDGILVYEDPAPRGRQ